MDLQYKDKKLEKIFNSDKELSMAYGAQRAKKIKIRLAVLRNAKHLGLVPSERPERRHKLSGNRDGQWSVDLDGNFRLIFEPVTDKNVNVIQLEEITVIRIIEVTDPH